MERGSHEISSCLSEYALPSTGVLSELLFERKLDTKLPSLREVAKVYEEVRDRDQDIEGPDEEVYGQNA